MPDMSGDWGRGYDADESPETRGEVTSPAQPAAELTLRMVNGYPQCVPGKNHVFVYFGPGPNLMSRERCTNDCGAFRDCAVPPAGPSLVYYYVASPATPPEIELLDYDSIVYQIQKVSLTLLPGLLAELVKRQVTTPFMRDDQALHNLVDRTLLQLRTASETWSPQEEEVLQTLQKLAKQSQKPSDATREAIRLLQNQKTRVKFPLVAGL